MAVNDIIKEADYNNIRNKIVSVMGSGSGNFGWGQASKIQSAAVGLDSKVSINDWGKLRYDIINAYTHLYGTVPTTAQVSEGYPVRYSNTFVPDTGPTPSTPAKTDSPVTQYNTWADTIVNNRFLIGSGQSATTTAVSTGRTSAWNGYVYCLVQVSFNTAAEARYFFNSGATIRITSSKTTSTVTSQNTTWTSLLSSAGTRSFGANTPGTGTSPMNGQNWYRLTSTDQTWYTLSNSSPYGANTYRIKARSNVSDNSSGTATTGYFLVEFVDGYTDPGPSGPGDSVDGTLTVSVDCLYPTGIFVPTGTGSFSVTLPTITIGSILGS